MTLEDFIKEHDPIVVGTSRELWGILWQAAHAEGEKVGYAKGKLRGLKEATVICMVRCGPYDSWKKNEKQELSSAIIELSNLIKDPFTTDEAINVASSIGLSLEPIDARKDK